MKADEGYSCMMIGGSWIIIDRYGKRIEGEQDYWDYSTARLRADTMNEEALARRFDNA